MSKVSAVALCAAVSICAAPAMAAGVVLDQSSIPETGTIGFAGGSANQVGAKGMLQTFTVGVAGYLDHVVVAAENWTFLDSGGGVRFEVQNAGYQTLYSQDFTPAQVPDFDFGGFNWADALQMSVRSADIAVLAGETYILKLAVLGNSGSVQWRTGYSQQLISYAGGENYTYDYFPNNPAPFALGGDFGFRTYVDTGPAAVPEPGAWALMILGFAGVGAGLRRRRASVVA